MLDLIRGAVLGLIQGLTEFFPVSSSGHLILVPAFFGWEDHGLAFDTVLHLGTLVAVVWVFRRDIAAILRGTFMQNDRAAKRLFLQVLTASVPGIMFGGLFGSGVEAAARGPNVVAFNLVFWGVMLYAADRVAAKRREAIRDTGRLGWGRALTVGFSQILALLPGTSRSGITMTSGLFTGLDRPTAVRFSFLVSIPTIAAAGGYGLLKFARSGAPDGAAWGLVAGFLAAAVSGAWAIRFLRAYVEKHSFNAFIAYRFALALLVVFVLR